MTHQPRTTLWSQERNKLKRGPLKRWHPNFSLFFFLLEIPPSIKECLHDSVKRIPMSQGSIYFKTALCVALEEMFNVSVVKIAFFKCPMALENMTHFCEVCISSVKFSSRPVHLNRQSCLYIICTG